MTFVVAAAFVTVVVVFVVLRQVKYYTSWDAFSTPSLFYCRLKTFLFCKSFPPQPFLFFFRTNYMIPQTFTVTSKHILFYFLLFLFLHLLVVVSVR